jgi:NADPH-dependent 7-cyano-7-deazaguanine reductase QueF
MTDEDIVFQIVAEVRDHQAAVIKYTADKAAWEARRDKLIEEVMRQVGTYKEDATKRVVNAINDDYPKWIG